MGTSKTFTLLQGSGGGGSATFEGYRGDVKNAVAGSNSVTFSSDIGTTNYQVFFTSEFGCKVATKSTNGFTFTANEAGSVSWLVIKDK